MLRTHCGCRASVVHVLGSRRPQAAVCGPHEARALQGFRVPPSHRTDTSSYLGHICTDHFQIKSHSYIGQGSVQVLVTVTDTSLNNQGSV